MIKVLHIFGLMTRGGAETRTVELMPLMAKKDVQFDYCVLKSEPGALDGRIRKMGGKVIPCALRSNVLNFGRKFVKLLRNSDYDIVHSHSHYFNGCIVWLAHKAGIKSRICHFRSIADGKGLTFKRKVYHKIMRRLIDKHSTAILAVCRGAMESGWSLDWRNDPRCHVIYNGLDLSGYERNGNEREDVRRELGLGNDSKLIINVGSFNPAKAHDVLLDAATMIIKEDSSFHFLLVGADRGGDNTFEAMRSKAHEAGIDKQVHFLGLRNDVPRLLKASDCFVLSSRREGLPGVVLEAVAAQLPIVATDLPGVREISEHTSLIFVVPIEDCNAISRKVLEVFRQGLYDSLEPNPFPLEFDLNSCAENLFKVYSDQVSKTEK